MTLNDTLRELASWLELDPVELVKFAAEDAVGGYHPHHPQPRNIKLGHWPSGSMFEVEGQTLYALVRALRPSVLVEFGSWHGCSTAHMAEALLKNVEEDGGPLPVIHAVDNGFEHGNQGIELYRPPERYAEIIKPHNMDYREFISEVGQGLTPHFILEDMLHEPEMVRDVWQWAAAFAPGAIVVSHDAKHHVVGEQVRAGIAQSSISDVVMVQTPPSDCGFAFGRVPAVNPELEPRPIEEFPEPEEYFDNGLLPQELPNDFKVEDMKPPLIPTRDHINELQEVPGLGEDEEPEPGAHSDIDNFDNWPDAQEYINASYGSPEEFERWALDYGTPQALVLELLDKFYPPDTEESMFDDAPTMEAVADEVYGASAEPEDNPAHDPNPMVETKNELLMSVMASGAIKKDESPEDTLKRLRSMTKKRLIAEAGEQGWDIPATGTKADIMDAIKGQLLGEQA